MEQAPGIKFLVVNASVNKNWLLLLDAQIKKNEDYKRKVCYLKSLEIFGLVIINNIKRT